MKLLVSMSNLVSKISMHSTIIASCSPLTIKSHSTSYPLSICGRALSPRRCAPSPVSPLICCSRWPPKSRYRSSTPKSSVPASPCAPASQPQTRSVSCSPAAVSLSESKSPVPCCRPISSPPSTPKRCCPPSCRLFPRPCPERRPTASSPTVMKPCCGTRASMGRTAGSCHGDSGSPRSSTF